MTRDEQSTPAEISDSLVDQSPRPARGALTKTGGFLTGYTHTLQPYIGCRFGCDYCYVKGLSVHRFHQPALDWGDYAHPRTGIAACLARELARLDAADKLPATKIFMSSSTDPYQGAERTWRLSRACLDTLIASPPALLVVQTRAPLVEDDFDRLRQLGDRAWLNITLETDRDDVRRRVTPRCPAIDRRWNTIARAQEAGLNVQITVSPLLPFTDVATFGTRLLDSGARVIIDTFTSGDGSAGRRTARTGMADRYAAAGWGDWRDERAARALHAWLQPRLGDRVGWSQAGFAALTRQDPTVAQEQDIGERQ